MAGSETVAGRRWWQVNERQSVAVGTSVLDELPNQQLSV